MAREIDLSLLRAFVTVSATGGMTAAGRHLNLTQAAVSQQIKRLEEQFETQLFDRSQRRLAMTPSGERLFAHAERILSLNDEIWGLMTSPAFEGQIRVGVPMISSACSCRRSCAALPRPAACRGVSALPQLEGLARRTGSGRNRSHPHNRGKTKRKKPAFDVRPACLDRSA